MVLLFSDQAYKRAIQADRGFKGAEVSAGPRSAPVEYERQADAEADPFGLDVFLGEMKQVCVFVCLVKGLCCECRCVHMSIKAGEAKADSFVSFNGIKYLGLAQTVYGISVYVYIRRINQMYHYKIQNRHPI